MAALAFVGALYFLFSPSGSVWFPKCPAKLLTGYDCPGCGFQRALHAALHGHFAEAIRYNFFLAIGIPYLLAAMVGSWGNGRAAIWVRRHLLSPLMLWIYIGLFFAWWIIRNILGI